MNLLENITTLGLKTFKANLYDIIFLKLMAESYFIIIIFFFGWKEFDGS